MLHRALLVMLALLPGSIAQAQAPVRYINPPGLTKPTGYTHVVGAGDFRAHPPANTLIPVATLARTGLLIEIEAVAVLPSPMATGAR
jgi:hypothetical protein